MAKDQKYENEQVEPEKWASVKGYEGLYEVSTYGRVRSSKRKGTPGKILKQQFINTGYYTVFLCGYQLQKQCLTHRLVAEAFLPNPDNLPEVNHIDECKTNNHLSNLEWCTRLQNVRHGTGIQRMIEAHDYYDIAAKAEKSRDRFAAAAKRARPVLQYDKDGNFIKRWAGSNYVEKETGFLHSNIIGACNGRLKTAYGYKWRYEGDTLDQA